MTVDPAASPAAPLRVLRHSPEALRWVRHVRGWSKIDLAEACGIARSTVSELETGARNTGPATLAKLAAALACPPTVLEAGQINQIATSPASALEMLDALLEVSDPAYVIHRDGLVHLGFLADSRHIGILHVREADFNELMTALRRHLPDRHGSVPDRHNNARGIARPKVKGSRRGHRELLHDPHTTTDGRR